MKKSPSARNISSNDLDGLGSCTPLFQPAKNPKTGTEMSSPTSTGLSLSCLGSATRLSKKKRKAGQNADKKAAKSAAREEASAAAEPVIAQPAAEGLVVTHPQRIAIIQLAARLYEEPYKVSQFLLEKGIIGCQVKRYRPQVFERNIPILLIKVKAELDRFDTGSITQDAIAEAFRQTMVDSRDDRDAQEPTRLLAVFVKKLDVLIDQESRRMLTEDHEEAQVVARAFP